ncbi:MAG: helix-turn-helix domain-containing protein [Coriobacteriales bacterium]
MGTSGKQFLESAIRMRSSDDIYVANSWIKDNFRESFSVEELASKWNMSPSSFHQKFKSAVGMGPLQCQKRLRLTEARRMMLDEGANVTEAAYSVGYESSSQFTRDYKKAFGATPSDDVKLLRELM